MPRKTPKKIYWCSPIAISIFLALFVFFIHLLTNSQYGYFRDELYFIAAGEHIDWGYVDFPPLIALIARIVAETIGTSLFAIRFLPAVSAGLKVLLAGLIVKELGGKRFATFLAGLSMIFSPAYLVFDNYFSMNSFEPIFWMGAVYFMLLAIKRKEPKFWLGFGILAGLGVMNKHAAIFFIFSLLIGLLLTKERYLFKSKWFWIAGGIAILIVLPNIIWEVKHDFVTLDFMKQTKEEGKNVLLSPLAFILEQFFLLNPLIAPVWIAGIWYFLFVKREYRVFSFAFLAITFIWIILSGKFYYSISAYPMLIAAGAVFWETKGKRWLKIAYPILLLVSGIIIAPIALPILPVEAFLSYEKALHLEPPKTEVNHVGLLPQYFGDMFGWPEMVDKVTKVYYNLTPEEREKCAIYARNYGEAGAIDLLGEKKGLPKAISGQLNYFLWGPRNYTGECVIALQYKKEDLIEDFKSVEETLQVSHPYAMAEENYTILVCRGLKQPLTEIWPSLKDWT